MSTRLFMMVRPVQGLDDTAPLVASMVSATHTPAPAPAFSLFLSLSLRPQHVPPNQMAHKGGAHPIWVLISKEHLASAMLTCARSPTTPRSQAENQPSTWASFYYNLHFLTMAMPAGLHFCFSKLNKTSLFIIVYALSGLYAMGAVLRMKVVLAPAASILGAVAVSDILVSYKNLLAAAEEQPSQKLKKTDNQKWIATSGLHANAVIVSHGEMLLCGDVFIC